MDKTTILSRKKLIFVLAVFQAVLLVLLARVFFLQYVGGRQLQSLAYEQQTRDRLITPVRGSILDRNMISLADTETVASVSVIHNQIEDREQVARVLSEKLSLDYGETLKKIDRVVALERIKTKVDKGVADEIRLMDLPGVVVDEDVKRVYPFDSLAAQVIGFVGRDNQGVTGLEAKYDKYLQGSPGRILTETDVRGREIAGGQEYRIAPVPGQNVVTSIDVILQQYAEQTIQAAVTAKEARRGAIIMMNPTNGEILAMANYPSFDLNDPFTINDPAQAASWGTMTQKQQMDALNQMWRNFSINDTYEPGSTFKVVTSIAGLDEGAVTPGSQFVCTGAVTVGGRTIKCWRYPRAHGAETFVQGVYNSCNPVFIQVAERLGAATFYNYMIKFGLDRKTGIDVPGEAVGIMHKEDKIGPVELATMSFGQSFQITPVQLLRAGSAVINGGHLITPHFVTKTVDQEGNITKEFDYPPGAPIVSQASSDEMRKILEGVVSSGTGNKTYLPGYRVGGKTATSQKLPRGNGKYIASFMAFAPADNPQVIALVLIDEPTGVYYGGTVTGPVMKQLLENALPYLKIKPQYTEEELKLPEAKRVTVPELRDAAEADAVKTLTGMGLNCTVIGDGGAVYQQFPLPGDEINPGTKVILYVRPAQ